MGRSVSEQQPHPASGEIVGRKHEIATVRRLLSGTRLLTLTGTGGVGKTRLATHVAAHVERAFPNGVWLVELAHVQDEGLLPVAIAEALGTQEEVPQPSTESMVDHLRTKQLLLILDNCEHLVEACARLADTLLRVAPKVHLLATSREALGVPGETLFIVPPMAFPGTGDKITESDVVRYDALALLMERAKNIAPETDIASDHVKAAQLCRLLDGIPLAIELAAVWLRVLSVDQIIDRLGDRLHFLTQGYRTSLPRHQTLRAAVDWSFDLCSDQEQILWERLSVFSGGFDLPAAEEICSTEPLSRDDILPLLAALTEKSVVTSETCGSRSRYRILETLRQYGHDRLTKSKAAAATHRRHADHYRTLAERNRHRWFGPDQVECLTTVAPELPNLRAALDHCLGDDLRVEDAIQIFTSLYGYWCFFGGPAEARHWFDRLLACEQLPPGARFDVLATGVLFALMQGRREAAQPLIEECASLAEYGARGEATAMGQFLSGRLTLMKGDYRGAVGLLESSREWYEHHQDEIPVTRVLRDAFMPTFYLTLAAIFAKDPRASHWITLCRDMAESGGARGEISMALWSAGIERWRAGDLEQATSLMQAGLRLERSTGYHYSTAWMVESLAWVAAAQRRDTYSAHLLGAAGTMRRLLEVSLEGFCAFDTAHRACETSVRERLGEQSWHRAFEAGAEFDFDEAVAFALQEPVEPSPESPGAPAPASGPAPSVLTVRELEVARLVADGVRNKDIAARLVISQRTAEGHVEHILEKLGFTSRTQVAAWYVHNAPPQSDPDPAGG